MRGEGRRGKEGKREDREAAGAPGKDVKPLSLVLKYDDITEIPRQSPFSQQRLNQDAISTATDTYQRTWQTAARTPRH